MENKIKDPKKVKRGKKSKAQGAAFELRVRKDLEEKGWIVDKWSNNVELTMMDKGIDIEKEIQENEDVKIIAKRYSQLFGKLIPAKPAYAFNPKLKMRIPLARGTGFPDFIAFTEFEVYGKSNYGTNRELKQFRDLPEYEGIFRFKEVIGVESKMDGKLDKEEKEKARWLLDNHIFSKILIAEKTKVKNKIVIVYHDFEEKYGNSKD